jgi:hypothetical protein
MPEISRMPSTTPPADAALVEWKRLRERALHLKLQAAASNRPREAALVACPSQFPIGKFNNLGSLRLRWVEPNLFEFLPRADAFSFARANGETITPRNCFTDGGSIPRMVRVDAKMDPWGYGPAYILHDWLFDTHHCEIFNNQPGRSLGDANAVLMEAIHTLTAVGIAAGDPIAFNLIYAAVSSFVGRSLWNEAVLACPLPPDKED